MDECCCQNFVFVDVPGKPYKAVSEDALCESCKDEVAYCRRVTRRTLTFLVAHPKLAEFKCLYCGDDNLRWLDDCTANAPDFWDDVVWVEDRVECIKCGHVFTVEELLLGTKFVTCWCCRGRGINPKGDDDV